MDLNTHAYRLIVTNHRTVYRFRLFWSYIDHFWYQFYIIKGSESGMNTYFIHQKNLSPFKVCFMVYRDATEREDMIMWTILMSQGTNDHSGNPFYKSEFKFWFGIMIVFVLFVFQHAMKWTLTLLVCWYIYYEGLPIGHTWRLYQIFPCNGRTFHEHLRNI